MILKKTFTPQTLLWLELILFKVVSNFNFTYEYLIEIYNVIFVRGEFAKVNIARVNLWLGDHTI